jgi:predicted DCC family thiol-disulfide oxidoreductase YuxK
VNSEFPKSTVYFDGSCSLCRAEIGYYRRIDQDRPLCFADISKAGAVPPEGITQERAMKHFHVRASDGTASAWAAAPRRIDSALVKAIARAFRWRKLLEAGVYITVGEIAAAEKCEIEPKRALSRDRTYAIDYDCIFGFSRESLNARNVTPPKSGIS